MRISFVAPHTSERVRSQNVSEENGPRSRVKPEIHKDQSRWKEQATFIIYEFLLILCIVTRISSTGKQVSEHPI